MDVGSGEWTHFSFRIHRVSVFYFLEILNEFLLEVFVMFLDDDKSFGGKANLPCVSAPSLHGSVYCRLDVCIK